MGKDVAWSAVPERLKFIIRLIEPCLDRAMVQQVPGSAVLGEHTVPFAVRHAVVEVLQEEIPVIVIAVSFVPIAVFSVVLRIIVFAGQDMANPRPYLGSHVPGRDGMAHGSTEQRRVSEALASE